MFVAACKDGEGSTPGLERKMKDVSSEVTVSETESPGLERSRMYHSAGFTRASVRVNWRVDCQGRRRCCVISPYPRSGRGGNVQ